ncbi:MAG TPA: 23S rRNA (uracil(1939)-C(5))-methyltransferase RlmD [Terracidiphilus sp.]|nr:23S rRNA (uracil(1939)-C(5))-methyltransferase RlmD [Terracidiphilus sp.]
MSQATGEIVTLEKPVYGGDFLARISGKAVFVPLTLPGEQARIRIVEDKRAFARGEVESIVQAAPERVQPACPHFGACGGCHYQHAGYEAQVALKQTILRETLARAGVPAPAEISILAADPWRYRNRIRLAFDEHGSLGYRGRRSHLVIPLRECPIAAPLLLRAAFAAQQILPKFTPSAHPSELTLFSNHDESALLASIVFPRTVRISIEDLADAFRAQIPQLAGLELLAEAQRNQPPRRFASSGSDSLVYRATGFDYRVDHGAFFQVNRWLVDALVDRVCDHRTGQLAWDLFAGVGLFARRLAAGFQRVVAVESAPAAAPALAHNLRGTTAAAEPTTESSDTLAFLRRNRKAEPPGLIVLDPPRTGLGPETTSLLAAISAPELVYVSCDPATLARDLRALLASGYTLQSLTLADLFPQTFHLETVAHLCRA